MNASTRPSVRPLFAASALAVATVTLLFSSGCASMVKEPVTIVRATANDRAPQRENKTYTISCESELVGKWFVSNPPALLAFAAALEKQGYTEADPPSAATHLIRVEMGFGPRQRNTRQPIENPDSVRYQNVAAMTGQGRYTQILTERDDAEGSILIGPSGEQIPTGGWKTMIQDGERLNAEPVELSASDTLILRAWDTAERGRSPDVFAWEIVVQRPTDYYMPSPKHVGLLLGEATARVEAGLTGLPQATGPTIERKK